MRRSDRIHRKFAFKSREKQTAPESSQAEPERKSFYNKHYKVLLIIPAIVFIIAILGIILQVSETGTFINKGITLAGGNSITVTKANLDKAQIEEELKTAFPDTSINIRTQEEGGEQTGLRIESDIPNENQELSDAFIAKIRELTSATDDELNIQTEGAALGSSFFRQIIIALLVAFLLMAIVVFVYFKSLVPSGLVVLAAATDIIITIGVLDILNIKIGTAGIAALLMLIGYSVETDILLTMRVLKRKEGETVYEQIISSFKTGIMMNIATLVAVLAGLLVAQSPVLREILIIVVIGIFADMLNTWIQNAGLLRWHLETKGEK